MMVQYEEKIVTISVYVPRYNRPSTITKCVLIVAGHSTETEI